MILTPLWGGLSLRAALLSCRSDRWHRGASRAKIRKKKSPLTSAAFIDAPASRFNRQRLMSLYSIAMRAYAAPRGTALHR